MAVLPTATEVASLRFVVRLPGLWWRYVLAVLLFCLGTYVWLTGQGAIGLAVVLLGHLPLWVLRRPFSPGGATPVHEEMWAPAEEGWFARVRRLEDGAARWDRAAWDGTSWLGLLALACVAGVVAAALRVLYVAEGLEAAERVGAAAAVLLLPIWINGARSRWNPSELRIKGAALEVARKLAVARAGGAYDVIPLLAVRQGRRGRYPVDARLLLRPKAQDARGFVGIQIQVRVHNVRGQDLPYLYCVVLGEEGFALPGADFQFGPDDRRPTVFELGRDEGVDFLLVRQHVDEQGGWHTRQADIQGLVATALEVADQALAANTLPEEELVDEQPERPERPEQPEQPEQPERPEEPEEPEE